jgi:hypothetical protein
MYTLLCSSFGRRARRADKAATAYGQITQSSCDETSPTASDGTSHPERGIDFNLASVFPSCLFTSFRGLLGHVVDMHVEGVDSSQAESCAASHFASIVMSFMIIQH